MARKRYRVAVAAAAQRDLAIHHARIAQSSPLAARTWLRAARRHVLALGFMPERFEVIPEAAEGDYEFEYRHFLFGNYRILYRVEGGAVHVARVIYATRPLTPEMFQE